MCGVIGIRSRERSVDPRSLDRALAEMVHRGPDHQGHWVAPHGGVGLGSARLSIIDLETGDQPIANEDESLHLVANGEFYDFERIRRGLEARGHRFRTGSDSEIALHLYEEEGPGCLRHLRGEFAFLIWDEPRRRLFAARDRFGIKPLFYARPDGDLYLASEAKSLFAAGVEARWDFDSVYQQLFIGLHQDRTLFAGVYQVPAGHYLVAQENGAGAEQVEVVRYWDLDYPRLEETPAEIDEAERVEALRASLDEAVRLRLRSDVPVGCFLSGGLDSSAVIGLASRHAADPIRAFTISFGHGSYDEAPIAEETAARVGADFCPLRVDDADFADHLSDAIWHAETLGVNPHGVARYLQSRAVHEAGYKVVLSGEGSDEVLAGYGSLRQDVLSDGGAGREVPGELAAIRSILGFVPSWLGKLAVNRSIFHALLAPGYAREFAERDPYRHFLEGFDVEGQLAGREPLLQSLYLWARSILPNYILFAERLEMAHSIEVRLPFLDHHFVETARSLPTSMLLRGKTEKYVLREAVKDVLTRTVYERHKHPFTAPPASDGPENRLRELTREYLRGPALARVPFFDQEAVVALHDQLPHLDHSTRIGLDAVFLMILCTCFLQERYHL